MKVESLEFGACRAGRARPEHPLQPGKAHDPYYADAVEPSFGIWVAPSFHGKVLEQHASVQLLFFREDVMERWHPASSVQAAQTWVNHSTGEHNSEADERIS